MMSCERSSRSGRRGPFRGLLALTAVAALLGAAIASAGVYDAATRLTLHATPSHATAGERIVLRGRLSSSRPECRAHRRVQVVEVGGHPVAGVDTDRAGHFSVVLDAHRTEVVYARFGGSFAASYGASELCRPSVSKRVSIRIRRK